MTQPTTSPAGPCPRCQRDLAGERPVRLPTGESYCAACCERMATEDFELETGEPFVRWIEKHPVLVLRHQPLEVAVRRTLLIVTVIVTVLGLGLSLYGLGLLLTREASGVQAAGGLPEAAAPPEGDAPPQRQPRLLPPPSGLGYLLVGLACCALFGWLSWRHAKSWLRAVDYQVTIQDGCFSLSHRKRVESFPLEAVVQACVVRPGTVGATEGALGLADGRMLTLDTCLSDLHALAVCMDLHFQRAFPPSLTELAAERRERLRQLRGLA